MQERVDAVADAGEVRLEPPHRQRLVADKRLGGVEHEPAPDDDCLPISGHCRQVPKPAAPPLPGGSRKPSRTQVIHHSPAFAADPRQQTRARGKAVPAAKPFGLALPRVRHRRQPKAKRPVVVAVDGVNPGQSPAPRRPAGSSRARTKNTPQTPRARSFRPPPPTSRPASRTGTRTPAAACPVHSGPQNTPHLVPKHFGAHPRQRGVVRCPPMSIPPRGHLPVRRPSS